MTGPADLRAPAANTDRELWRETDDYYAPSIHVTAGGGIGINVGGTVFVKPVREWHALLARIEALTEALEPFARAADELRPDDADTMRPAIVQARHFRRARAALGEKMGPG